MIIKLDQSFSYALNKEEKAPKKLTYLQRVKTDRLVMIVLFLLTIIGAVIYS